MKLTDLNIKYEGEGEPEIKGIALDSRDVLPGYIFAALPGTKNNGIDYIPQAIEKGAVAIIVPEDTKGDYQIPIIKSDNPLRLTAIVASQFYSPHPQTIAAVTGTNGKTSTVYMTQQLWSAQNIKAVSIGTLGVLGKNIHAKGSLTTPDSVSLSKLLQSLKAQDIDHVAIEASSHGLSQFRLDGYNISVAAFTNLSHDHLDYHHTMENYFSAKKRLFTDLLDKEGTAVVNVGCPFGKRIADYILKNNIRLISYGSQDADLYLKRQETIENGQDLLIKVFDEEYSVNLPLVGEYQAMNILCALGITLSDNTLSKSDIDKTVLAIKDIKSAPGRMQYIDGHPKGGLVYVDYAHTPDALENVLSALKEHTQNNLFCVFGCGGDRDKSKRPVMGQIASKYSDYVIVTDDNPRTENPQIIRNEILAAAKNAEDIGDRKEAIGHALLKLDKGDVLVIAGKGHEQGQTIGNKVEPFDDAEVAHSFIRDMTEGIGEQ